MTDRRYCHLQIGLLGSFTLIVDGKPVESDVWTSKKAMAMLKYLAARPGRRIPTDVLIELLWPDAQDTDRTNTLHTAVWFVRRILTSQADPDAEAPLRYTNGAYWLDISPECIDAEQFKWYVRTSREIAKINPEMALAHCHNALELYRDDFLCEDLYEDWTIPYRDEYKELYFEAIKRSAELTMDYKQNLDEAIRVCRLGLQRDPYREISYDLGIKAYILGKRYVDAINLYKKYSKMLMDEFQLEPSPAIQELVAHLMDKPAEQAATSTPSKGAYVCSREHLEFHLETEMRRFERTGSDFSFLLVTNKSDEHQNPQMQAVFHILQRSLRNADLISQFDENLIVVFLPETNSAASEILWRRLAQILEERNINISAFSFTLLTSGKWDEMQEALTHILAD